MIRLNKPVKLLEWGEGTNTLNQVWSEIGQGKILEAKRKNGLTTLLVTISGAVEKKNAQDDAIKIVQSGEGMTSRSQKWGEVALGKLKSQETKGGQSLLFIEIGTATKFGRA